MVGGSNQYEGRVEICINNVWGTICDNMWDAMDASVACKQLGYSENGKDCRLYLSLDDLSLYHAFISYSHTLFLLFSIETTPYFFPPRKVGQLHLF